MKIWSFTTSTLVDGAHSIKAKATDAAGNASADSNVITITVDTVAPTAPVISTASATTSDSTPTILGTTDTGSTVELFDGWFKSLFFII